MTGADFYQLAVALGSGSSPAELRSATSRAYYGAFHMACAMLRDAGIVLPKDAACHEKDPQILGNSGDPEVIAAASKLGSLRTNRNDADYRLDKRSPERSQTVQLHLRVAGDIIECLRQCSSDGAKAGIRDAVRAYASKIQGPTIHEQ